MQLFIQMVYARDCNLNNSGVIHQETICAVAERPSFPLLRRGYTSIEKRSTSSSCAVRIHVLKCRYHVILFFFCCDICH